jgi:hypothetical protein
MSNFVEDRLNICNLCEYKVGEHCILCGCVIADKVTNPTESCPLAPSAKWGPFVSGQEKTVTVEEIAPVPPPPCKTCTRYR